MSTLFRGGEGFTAHEQQLLADFLETEIALWGLFQAIGRNAIVQSRSDVFKRHDGNSWTRTVQRTLLPVETPGVELGKRRRSVLLSDVTTLSQQTVGAHATLTTEWYCNVAVKTGRNTRNNTRPTIARWHITDDPLLNATPEQDPSWHFSEPSEVLALISDDVGHHNQVDQQADAIRELQRVHALLTSPAE